MSAPTSRGTGAQEAILTHAKALYKADKFKKSLAQFKLVSLTFPTLVGLLGIALNKTNQHGETL